MLLLKSKYIWFLVAATIALSVSGCKTIEGNKKSPDITKTSFEKGLSPEVSAITKALAELEFDQALLLLKEQGESDDPSVILIRAFCHELGIGEAIDSNKARELAIKAAEKEDWEAAQFLAWQSITGYVGDPNLFEAEDWRKKIDLWKSKADHSPALPETIMVPGNKGYIPRFELVTPWIQRKALEKDPLAQYNLYKILMDGRSTNANVNLAMNWLNQSAESGYPPAAKMMAFYYEYGFILQKNEVMEMRYLRIAADGGDVDSQYSLAKILLNPSVGEKDLPTAIHWLEKAAEQNHANANEKLGELFYDGEEIDQDFGRAYSYYSKAAELGEDYAMYMMAWMVFYGQGVELDKAKGIKLFQDAANNGSRSAALRLAETYLWGWSTDKNPLLAKSWAEKAIELGNEYAYRILGELHYNGQLGEVDIEKAFENFEIAARDGDEDSQCRMGDLLLRGKGIDRDLEEAYSWYKLSSGKGHKLATTMVMMCEGLGWGTEQNKERMIDYFQAKRGGMELSEGMKAKIMTALEDPQPRSAKISSVKAPTDQEWKQAILQAIERNSGTTQVIPPKPYSQPSPKYPEILRMLNIEETVTIMMVVGENGKIIKHEFVNAPLPQFKEAVDEILPKWRFIPGMKDGKPVSTRIRIPIPFQIRD